MSISIQASALRLLACRLQPTKLPIQLHYVLHVILIGLQSFLLSLFFHCHFIPNFENRQFALLLIPSVSNHYFSYIILCAEGCYAVGTCYNLMIESYKVFFPTFSNPDGNLSLSVLFFDFYHRSNRSLSQSSGSDDLYAPFVCGAYHPRSAAGNSSLYSA